MASWSEVSPGGEAYAARFAKLAASGAQVHGEADLVEALVPSTAKILDAGCGTGRVAIRLRQRGFDVDGVDVDADMLAVARAADPAITWQLQDLERFSTETRYDLILLAGNVVPLCPDPSAAIASLRRALAPQALLVAGFGLDRAHLPTDASIDLATYDAICADAGLATLHRWSTWQRDPYDGGGYAVSVHR